MRSRFPLLLLAAAALLAPAAAGAQISAPRDTIRIGAEPADTAGAPADSAARPARNPRWAQPFAVETSGQVAARPPARDVVWLNADSVRARRLAAAAARDSAAAEEDGEDSTLAAADSSDAADSAEAPPPPRTRRAAADSSASTRRAGSRTAARDTAATGRRSSTGSRSTRADSAATTTRRTTAPRDSSSSTRRTASRDTATRRATAGRPRTHTVASGETLYGIARRYSVTSAQIRALNPDLGETLEVGTVLRLPAGARAPGQPAARPDPSDDDDRPSARRTTATRADTASRRPGTPARTGGRRTHTVAAHETLFGIARRYGVSVDAIRRANRLEGDALRPGQTLVIPAPAPKP